MMNSRRTISVALGEPSGGEALSERTDHLHAAWVFDARLSSSWRLERTAAFRDPGLSHPVPQ